MGSSVVKWIGSQINEYFDNSLNQKFVEWQESIQNKKNEQDALLYLLNGVNQINQTAFLNSSNVPNEPEYGDLKNIIEPNHALEKFYLSAKACAGILRRKRERNMKMNSELELLMKKISGEKTETAENEKSQHITVCTSNSCLSALNENDNTD